MHWGKVWLIGLALMTMLGCGGGGPAPDTSPPTISEVQANPRQLPRFTSGRVKISAQVSDSSGVAEVWAEVKKPDGTKEWVRMSREEGVYQVEREVAANSRSDGKVETYQVWVRAKDAKGNETPEPGVPTGGVSFTVPAPKSPPARPGF